jgi:4'-phosphopantetheinyl transferase
MRNAIGTVPVVWVEPGTPASSWPVALPPSASLFVIAVAAPDSTNRTMARQRIRAALQSVLGTLRACDPARVMLTSTPGEPLRAHGPHSPIWGLSVSHEAGLSVAAVNRFGPVGVDIARETSEWDWHGVAHDYLGPDVASDIAAQPSATQKQAFLRAWTRHEARLKCLSLGLVEWSPTLQSRLVQLQVANLDLPTGWLGAIASG